MLNISMKNMLEAGVHFGHQTYRWNPKMSRFIFGERNGIHILDLQKTVKEIKKTYNFVKDAAKEGRTFLFVGTKKQAKDIVREEAEKAGVPCVLITVKGGQHGMRGWAALGSDYQAQVVAWLQRTLRGSVPTSAR